MREDRPQTERRGAADQPADRTGLLIAELQDRVSSLEEANRENRRIIEALTSRIPAIGVPDEATGAEATEQGSERLGTSAVLFRFLLGLVLVRQRRGAIGCGNADANDAGGSGGGDCGGDLSGP